VTGRLRAPRHKLVEALRGAVTDHHRFLLELHLEQVEALERSITKIEARLHDLLEPFRGQIELLITIPGVSDTVAHTILAEVGPDMSRFPTHGHLISWVGLCPRMDESAGKRRSTRLRPGAPWLKTVMVQAAWAATRTRSSYLRAQFLRIKSRRGAKKAIVAVAASMLQAAYFILRDGVPYKDLGPDYFDQRNRNTAVKRLTRRIESLGYKVELRPAA
jgi:transposase